MDGKSGRPQRVADASLSGQQHDGLAMLSHRSQLLDHNLLTVLQLLSKRALFNMFGVWGLGWHNERLLVRLGRMLFFYCFLAWNACLDVSSWLGVTTPVCLVDCVFPALCIEVRSRS